METCNQPSQTDCLFFQIKSRDSVVRVGPLHLQTDPVKNTFVALAVSWKTKYAELMHNEAKVRSWMVFHSALCLLDD